MTKAIPRARFAKGLTLALTFVTALAVVAMALPSHVAAAEPLPLTVYGDIRDSVNQLVIGAHVVIKNNMTGKTYELDSDEDGQYMCDIPENEWTRGDEIMVTATYGSTMGYGYGVAPAFAMVNINVKLSEAIPEFGSALGATIAALLAGTVAIVAISRPRKQ